MSDTPELVMLVDGNNLLMRCIKAMEYSGLRGGENWQTGPLTAFIGALGRFTRENPPAYLVICWDSGPSERRKRLYEGYKAARKTVDPEHQERKETAFGMVRMFLDAARIQQVGALGYEADDVIAAYWARTYHETQFDWDEGDLPYKTMIVSGDKDFFQLLDMGTCQLRPNNAGGYELWTRERFEREYGFAARMMPSYMALVGDPVDGVPGVHGIGPKKAVRGLQEAGWDLTKVKVLEDEQKYASAMLSAALVDLRETSWHPCVPQMQRFRPLDPSEGGACLNFVKLLHELKMETVLNRFYTRTLWH